METVRLIFKYTQNEYVKAERQYLTASKIIRRYDIIIAAFLFLIALNYLYFSSFSTFSIIALILVLTVTTLGILVYFFIPIYKFKQTAKYHDEYTLIFSKDMIKFQTPSIQSELKWDNYSEIWENGDFYFLIQAPRIYTLIPKRAFQNETQKQLFHEMAILNLDTIIPVN